MSELFWLSAAQMTRIAPHFPCSRGVARVDDRRVLSGILHVIGNGLRWRDAPAAYGPCKAHRAHARRAELQAACGPRSGWPANHPAADRAACQ